MMHSAGHEAIKGQLLDICHLQHNVQIFAAKYPSANVICGVQVQNPSPSEFRWQAYGPEASKPEVHAAICDYVENEISFQQSVIASGPVADLPQRGSKYNCLKSFVDAAAVAGVIAGVQVTMLLELAKKMSETAAFVGVPGGCCGATAPFHGLSLDGLQAAQSDDMDYEWSDEEKPSKRRCSSAEGGGVRGGKKPRFSEEQVRAIMASVRAHYAAHPSRYTELVLRDMRSRFPDMELDAASVRKLKFREMGKDVEDNGGSGNEEQVAAAVAQLKQLQDVQSREGGSHKPPVPELHKGGMLNQLSGRVTPGAAPCTSDDTTTMEAVRGLVGLMQQQQQQQQGAAPASTTVTGSTAATANTYATTTTTTSPRPMLRAAGSAQLGALAHLAVVAQQQQQPVDDGMEDTVTSRDHRVPAVGGKRPRLSAEQMKALVESVKMHVHSCPERYTQLVIADMGKRYPGLSLNMGQIRKIKYRALGNRKTDVDDSEYGPAAPEDATEQEHLMQQHIDTPATAGRSSGAPSCSGRACHDAEAAPAGPAAPALTPQ